MKQLIQLTTVLLLISWQLTAKPLTIGDQAPDLVLDWIDKAGPDALSEFRGKVVLIDFWATWCSPCIKSMKHLETLQDRFEDDLVVIAVSEEAPERIRRFRQHTGLPFLYAQSSTTLRQLFPHRVIPHTIVLTPDLRVAAITEPGALTAAVISQILQGQTIDLPRKEDRPWDISKDIFDLDTTARESFQIQPARPEAPTYARTYHAGPFQGRRLSFINFQIPMLYREAFGTTAYRMDYPEPPRPERYCADLLVPVGAEAQLTTKLRDSLDRYFGWSANWQTRELDVVVLTADSTGIRLPTADGRTEPTAAGDHFRSQGATTTDFADYLESFGIVGMPVVDETDSDQLYRFDFSFEPEDPKSFFTALSDMGLKVKKEKRAIEILTLRAPE